jgi:AraC-like DNA-binding protein
MDWKDCFGELLHELLYEDHLNRILSNYFYKDSAPGELMCEMHQHNSLEVDCVIDGDVFLHFENDAAHVAKNEVLLIKPYVKHLFKAGTEGCTRANIQLNTYQIKSNSLNKFLEFAFGDKPHVKLKKNTVICTLLKNISLEMDKRETEYSTLVKMEIVSLLIHLIRAIQTDMQYKNNANNPYVIQAIAIIRSMIWENFTPKDIARKLHISEGYLMHIFKRETGCSIMRYATQLRIEESKTQLVYTDKKISDIAIDVGLPNLQHFSILFKKYIGLSPLNFRKMSREIKGMDIEVQREAEKQ